MAGGRRKRVPSKAKKEIIENDWNFLGLNHVK